MDALHIRSENRLESSDFASWMFVVQATRPYPTRRPAWKTTILR